MKDKKGNIKRYIVRIIKKSILRQDKRYIYKDNALISLKPQS